WPDRWSVERLSEIEEKLGPYGWNSLYQGRPRKRGGSVFNDVHFYDEAPKHYRVSIGLDLAYTKKTSSDWCVAVVLAESEGKYYVLDVVRRQCRVPEFAGVIRQLKTSYPGARMSWHTSTTEQGLADLMRSELGFPVFPELAQADKFVRAQLFFAAEKGNPEKQIAPRVFLPRQAAWLNEYVAEFAAFTGVNDKHDDQVDASASAFDALPVALAAVPKTHPTQFGRGVPQSKGMNGFQW